MEQAGETITARDATVDDAEAITRAHVRAWQVAYKGIMDDSYLAALEDELPSRIERRRVNIGAPDNPRVFNLVAETGTGGSPSIAGWLAGGPSRDDDTGPGCGEVWAIYLDPERWGAGIGSALMAAGLDRLASEGYSEAILWVFEANRRARGFYERWGWRPDGATHLFDHPGGQAPEIRYRRPIP